MQQEWSREEEEKEALTDTLFVDVILPFSLPNTFTYRVPREWDEWIQIGQRVVVPFGKKKYYAGLVSAILTQGPREYEARYLHSILDDVPLIGQKHLDFWRWIASYYLCNMGDVMSAALPAGLKLASETKILPDPDVDELPDNLSEQEIKVLEVLRSREVLTITEVQEVSGIRNVFPLIKSLYLKQLIYTGEEMAERYRPKMRSMLRLAPAYQTENALRELLPALEKKAAKQADVVLKYLSVSPLKEWIDKLAFQKSEAVSAPALKALADKGVFELVEKRVDRLDETADGELRYELNEEQQKALEKIKAYWQEKPVVLLHGITGSGKSFVYFDLIKEALEKGKQILYLLPEIALTVQLVGKIRNLFGSAVYVSHSRFNENERVEVYRKVASGEPCIVVGARSSLFLPYQDLGLVIVDEEHEASYKQHDPAPRYQARDAAIVLAGLFDAKILLGSATPSVESYFNARNGKYGLVVLKNRFGEAALPYIELVNLGEMQRKKRMHGSFSVPLLEAIQENVQAKKQVILFQNRKGYVPIVLCKSCGWTAKCISCDISLTYYKSTDSMRCHYCGYSQRPIKACPTCGSAHLEMSGFGTELIEEELHLKHPEYRIARFDQNSIRGKHAHHRLVHEFEDQELDILVGTQMLAKGLDFEGVSLVGVIQADQLLNFPHFRSFERAFQLLTQVAGRAGRRKDPGKVIIQTYRPEHAVLEEVINHNYERFFSGEIAEREKFHYPPFYKLIEVSVKSMDLPLLEKAAVHLAGKMKEQLGSRVMGPETPYVSKVRNFYVRRLLIKLEKEQISHLKVKQQLRHILDIFHSEKTWRNVRVQFDVDPA